ncbi:MAG: hypothetical protein J1F20_05430 [Muribaculaceae bacterium]|nr:hypothetical protein [Muribaculaceae bacterium]
MKTFNKIGAGILCVLATLTGLTACQEFDTPVLNAPVASNQANTTILELKQAFWDDATNYIWGTADKEDATPAAVPVKEDGSHYIIKGTVVSSDEAGNVFKSLVIQDETAALAISINSYNLYLKYRRGQEVIIDVTGMYIGKYNGLLQLGMPEWYANGNAWEASFMSPEFFQSHVELNGWPVIANVDTIEVNTFSELSSDPDGLMKWQSQLVRFNNVSFANGGVEKYSEYHSSGVNQSLMDSEGNSLTVRTSGYSNFWNQTLPEGKFDFVCIASYYGTTGWQLIMIDADAVINLGNPTESPGVESKPWSVDEAITEINAGRTPYGWTQGYIVGAVAPEVSEVTSNNDIEWTATPILGNTLVIGQTPDTKDIAHALVIELTPGSKFYTLGNLVDHPENYGKQINVQATLGKYLGTYGLIGNRGTAGTFKIEGVEDNTELKEGDGTETSPYTANQVIALAKTDASTAWVVGYIVGSSPGMSASDFVPGADGASGTNIFIANNPDETDYMKCVPVQLPTGAVRTALNLASNPGLVGAKVTLYGTLEKYFGQSGLKNVSDYVLDDNAGSGGGTDTPTPDVPGTGTGTEANPYSATQVVNGTGTGTTAWFEGYIVGSSPSSYASDMTSATGASASASNIFVAANAGETDYTKCVPVQLVSGTTPRSALNLKDNPGNLGKKVKLYGSLEKYFGQNGMKSTSEYQIDGGGGNTPSNPDTPSNPGTPGADGVYSVAAALSLIASGNIPSGNVQVRGIIASITEVSTSYGNATYIIKDQLSDATGLTVYRGYYIDGAKFTSADQIAVGGTVVVEGELVNYMGNTPEFTTGNHIVSYTAPGGSTPSTPDTPDVPDTPQTPTGDFKGDFNSFNGGKATASPYGTYSNATGWVATNSIVLGGTTNSSASNPYFTFIGGDGVLAPTLNGKVGSAGTLTSPTLAGGIGTLTFDYGFAFAETKCSFTVTVKDASGTVVKTDTVDLDTIQQKTAYHYSLAVNHSGNFVIEIVNNCKTQNSGNKDRVSIWNLTWTN